MKAKLLISVFGEDRAGLVKRISDVVKNQQGNWLESRLSHLGNRFAGLILAEFDASQVDLAYEALTGLSSEDLDIRVESSHQSPTKPTVTLQVVGNDKPGIVHEIASGLSLLRVNVESLESEVEPAAMSGGQLFKASLKLSLPQGISLGDVRQQLESIANDLMVDFEVDQQ